MTALVVNMTLLNFLKGTIMELDTNSIQIYISASKALRGAIGKKPRSERVDPSINIPKIPEKLSDEIVANSPSAPEVVLTKDTTACPTKVVLTKDTTACPTKVVTNEVKMQGEGEIKIANNDINIIPKAHEKSSINITAPPAAPEVVKIVKSTASPAKVVPRETEVKSQGGGEIKRPSILKVSQSNLFSSPPWLIGFFLRVFLFLFILFF